MTSRRSILVGGAALAAAAQFRPALAAPAKFRLGVTDWNLRQTGKVEAVALAKKLGFDGVEVSLGINAVDNKLPLDNADKQDAYLKAAQEHGIALAGTCLDILHRNYLKNDKLGAKWVADGIPITKKLNAKVMLLPFFGRGALTTQEEKEYVADVLKEIAPEAEKAGVVLGLENTISAADNVKIMERAGNPPALKVYYDVGNSTNGGFDILREIRWLGKDRICQMHLKDNPYYLGEGRINFPAVMKAINEIGFSLFANLETDSPAKDVEADMRRNIGYVRKLMAEA
ncbi:MAG: sugar phosphate isomerase/epimerase family protein [Bryobacteraceae bacterium]|nr:sugar phosphate isomerase/epimerase family protein [Bryobacteraceae bacterium]